MTGPYIPENAEDQAVGILADSQVDREVPVIPFQALLQPQTDRSISRVLKRGGGYRSVVSVLGLNAHGLSHPTNLGALCTIFSDSF